MFKNIKLLNLIIFIIAGIVFVFIFIIAKRTDSQKSYPTLIKIEKQYGGRHKKTVIEDLNIGEFTQSPPPFYPIGSFDGQLKKIGKVKIVIGISGRSGHLAESLQDIFYILRYLKEHKIKYKIKVVLYGSIVTELNANKYKTSGNFYLFRQEYKKGVRFYVDYNSLIINHLLRSQIPYFITTSPVGILKIYLLREKGYLFLSIS